MRTVIYFSRHTGQIVIKLIERKILNLSKYVISVMFLKSEIKTNANGASEVSASLWKQSNRDIYVFCCHMTLPSVLRQQTSVSINYQK